MAVAKKIERNKARKAKTTKPRTRKAATNPMRPVTAAMVNSDSDVNKEKRDLDYKTARMFPEGDKRARPEGSAIFGFLIDDEEGNEIAVYVKRNEIPEEAAEALGM